MGSKTADRASITSLLPIPVTPSKRMNPRARVWMTEEQYLVVCAAK